MVIKAESFFGIPCLQGCRYIAPYSRNPNTALGTRPDRMFIRPSPGFRAVPPASTASLPPSPGKGRPDWVRALGVWGLGGLRMLSSEFWRFRFKPRPPKPCSLRDRTQSAAGTLNKFEVPPLSTRLRQSAVLVFERSLVSTLEWQQSYSSAVSALLCHLFMTRMLAHKQWHVRVLHVLLYHAR